MVPWLRSLAALEECMIQFLALAWQRKNHPVPVTLTPSSGLHGYCTHKVFESKQTKHSFN